jgi:DNA-binding NarL/FixJ family response regulator
MATLDTLRRVIAAALDATLVHGHWYRETQQVNVDDEGHDLTPRQHEIAALLLSGHTNKEIGIRLGLAEITVKTHLTALFRRLGVANRIQAAMAIRMLGVEQLDAPRGVHASHPSHA